MPSTFLLFITMLSYYLHFMIIYNRYLAFLALVCSFIFSLTSLSLPLSLFVVLSLSILPLTPSFPHFPFSVLQRSDMRVAIWTTTPWTIPANLAVAVNRFFSLPLYHIAPSSSCMGLQTCHSFSFFPFQTFSLLLFLTFVTFLFILFFSVLLITVWWCIPAS